MNGSPTDTASDPNMVPSFHAPTSFSSSLTLSMPTHQTIQIKIFHQNFILIYVPRIILINYNKVILVKSSLLFPKLIETRSVHFNRIQAPKQRVQNLFSPYPTKHDDPPAPCLQMFLIPSWYFAALVSDHLPEPDSIQG